jgi:hypothetical protein
MDMRKKYNIIRGDIILCQEYYSGGVETYLRERKIYVKSEDIEKININTKFMDGNDLIYEVVPLVC